MLGGEVVEGKQRVAILDETLDRLLIFAAVGFDEGIEGGFGAVSGLCHPDIVQRALGLAVQAVRQCDFYPVMPITGGPNPPFVELGRLSRLGIAEEIRQADQRRLLGDK